MGKNLPVTAPCWPVVAVGVVVGGVVVVTGAGVVDGVVAGKVVKAAADVDPGSREVWLNMGSSLIEGGSESEIDKEKGIKKYIL